MPADSGLWLVAWVAAEALVAGVRGSVAKAGVGWRPSCLLPALTLTPRLHVPRACPCRSERPARKKKRPAAAGAPKPLVHPAPFAARLPGLPGLLGAAGGLPGMPGLPIPAAMFANLANLPNLPAGMVRASPRRGAPGHKRRSESPACPCTPCLSAPSPVGVQGSACRLAHPQASLPPTSQPSTLPPCRCCPS